MVASGEWRDYGISSLKGLRYSRFLEEQQNIQSTGLKKDRNCEIGKVNMRLLAWMDKF